MILLSINQKEIVMTAVTNFIQKSYTHSKTFVQDHKYQLAAGATGISAIALAALALYSGRFSLPQSSMGKALFIGASAMVSGGIGAVTGGAYLASKTDTSESASDIALNRSYPFLIGAQVGGSIGVGIGAIGASILLNR